MTECKIAQGRVVQIVYGKIVIALTNMARVPNNELNAVFNKLSNIVLPVHSFF